ncbi:Phosphoribosylanthranilate isomerase [hydrothermal vent metagenome]|uniref:phosphoribosylanthranilate isomerase n=1 Tax=hydrothermal vent metagenome TaxID=652676 RepID=A0A3B0SNJ7_9ZZZZ
MGKKAIKASTMKTQIKICGLSTETTVDAAIQSGASHFGLVHFEKSPRHVSLERAAELRQHASDRIKTVLLLVNADPKLTGQAIDLVKPDIVQFHGGETAEWLNIIRKTVNVEIWKALGLRSAKTLDDAGRYDGIADRLVYDTPAKKLPGGTGESFDWSLLANHTHIIDWALAGGLDLDNVGEALQITGAPMVDVSSGVESAPGVKDVDKITAFCQAVQEYDASR